MSRTTNRTNNRTTANKMQMFVAGTIVVATLLRLPSQDSGPALWVNIFLLVLGTAGFLFAAMMPKTFERKQ